MEKTNENVWFVIAFIIWIFIAWYCISSPHNCNYPSGTTEEDIRGQDIW